jgi:hypothetical protein
MGFFNFCTCFVSLSHRQVHQITTHPSTLIEQTIDCNGPSSRSNPANIAGRPRLGSNYCHGIPTDLDKYQVHVRPETLADSHTDSQLCFHRRCRTK